MMLFDIWALDLDDCSGVSQSSFQVLSPDEIVRAERYRSALHRSRFISARVFLRSILGSYLKIHPSAIEFLYNEWGKPSIGNYNPLVFQFNLSHSHSKAVVAVTRGVSVGVDIELIQPLVALEDTITQSFSPHERRSLVALPAELRVKAFYRCWTSKEAYLKGRGDGLNISLADFDVCVDPNEPPALLRPYAGDSGWVLHALDIVDNHAVAVAVCGQTSPPRLRIRSDLEAANLG